LVGNSCQRFDPFHVSGNRLEVAICGVDVKQISVIRPLFYFYNFTFSARELYR